MQAVITYITSRLASCYPPEEALEIAYWIVEETTGMNRFAARTHTGTKDIPDLDNILEQLRNYVPVQYIFGHTEWMGLNLHVTPATLIPRPETAELAELVCNHDYRFAHPGSPVRVLDAGTGSGCIALALKRRHPEWHIEGTDKSRDALDVARTNAQNLKLDVRFYEADILQDELAEYDIIVSNPPYIRPSERNTMTENTLRCEPGQALFVPEDDPLLFYRRIAGQHKADELWFEISETQGEAMLTLMQQMGYDARCLNDIYGKQRFIHASKRR